MKSALNLVLIADSESTQKMVQTRTGIIDLGAFCVELWPKQVLHRISVPMSYISCSRLRTIHEKQQMRIQGCHFLKSALNLDLTLSDDGECRTFFDSLRNY